jgi:hypothetical protein
MQIDHHFPNPWEIISHIRSKHANTITKCLVFWNQVNPSVPRFFPNMPLLYESPTSLQFSNIEWYCGITRINAVKMI